MNVRLSMRRRLLDLAIMAGLACAIAGAVIYMTFTAVKSARQSSCTGRITTIAAILRAYTAHHGSPPPIAVYNERGEPMHSWRLLLARLEFPDEFAGYDMAEPWNSPNNLKYLERMPGFLRCDNESHSNDGPTETSYVGVKSEGAFIDPNKDHGDATGQESTRVGLMIVEMAESGIPWTEPRDLDVDAMSFVLNDFAHPSIRSHDPTGPVVLMSDMAYERLNAERANDSPGVIESLIRRGATADDRKRHVKQGVFERFH